MNIKCPDCKITMAANRWVRVSKTHYAHQYRCPKCYTTTIIGTERLTIKEYNRMKAEGR